MSKGFNIAKRVGLTIQVIKTALSAGIAWALATEVAQIPYPYFAPLAAVVVGQVTVADSLQKAINRVIGVIVGVIVTIFLGHWIHLNALSIFLVILVGMAMSTAIKLNSQIISQVGVSSLMVLSVGNESGYALGRIVETILGSAVAIVINALIIPPNEIFVAEKSFSELSLKAATTLRKLGNLYKLNLSLTEGLTEARKLSVVVDMTSDTIKLADDNLKYSPLYLNRRERVKQLKVGMAKLERIAIEIRGIARGLHDIENDLEVKDYLVDAIEATADCIQSYGNLNTSSKDGINSVPNTTKNARKMLSRCLTNLNCSKDVAHFIEIGGILSDLNRILRETSNID